jgi:ubiquinone/menaquinone biosynthesis C-methylase UbiE
MMTAQQLYEQAITLFESGRYDEAVARCREAVILKPDFAEARSNLGVMLAALGRLDEAAAALRQALDDNPALVDTRLNLGVILNRLIGKNSGQALLADRNQDAGEVRRHYENLPFPPRDPEAERYVLKVSTPDILAKINHYCFGGSRDFSQPFRVLAAGCGTGDSVIWLAHQLADTPAEIVAIDLSEASLAVAKARAEVRGLDKIAWVHGSLLEVADLGLGRFDYITCLGVLHHLPDPTAGLRALESVLADQGAMAIMVYGAVGRSHIYSTQRLLQLATKGLEHPADRLAVAKRIVANLPATNDFRQREGDAIKNTYLEDDTNFWDTLLHAQDRAYTVSQFRDYLASAGLTVQGFTSYMGVSATTALQYDLDFQLDDPAQSARLAALSPAEREDAAEILDGSLSLHTVYVRREPLSALDPTADEAILSPMSESARSILTHLAGGTEPLVVHLRNRSAVPYHPAPITRRFLGTIDGHRSNAEIAASLGLAAGSAAWALVKRELRIPCSLHWVTARTEQGTYLPPLADRGGLSLPLIHREPSMLAV